MVDPARCAPPPAVIGGVGQVHAVVIRPGGVHVSRRVDRDSREVVGQVSRCAGGLVNDVVGEGQGAGTVHDGRHADRHVRGVQRRASRHGCRAGRTAHEDLVDISGPRIDGDVADLVVGYGTQVDTGLAGVDCVIGRCRRGLPRDDLALVDDDLIP